MGHIFSNRLLLNQEEALGLLSAALSKKSLKIKKFWMVSPSRSIVNAMLVTPIRSTYEPTSARPL